MFRICPLLLWLVLPSMAYAQEPSPAAGLLRLLKSGRIPKERQGSIVKLVCDRGNADDLGYVFGQVGTKDGFSPEVEGLALEGLAEAASTRKVVPSGDLSRLKGMMADASPRMKRLWAVRLAGLWKVESVRNDLAKFTLGESTPAPLREAAIASLVRLAGDKTRATLDRLTSKDRPLPLRYLGVAGLVGLDIGAASTRAADVLADASAKVDPAPLLSAFLDRKGGPEKLATALGSKKIPADVAKLMLRHLYSVGRSDAALVAALSKAAGISATPKKLTEAEVKTMVEEIRDKADPERGEAIFRRADLSCSKCHAIHEAGGGVGPDLRAVGSTSPPDYILKSILYPAEAVKEEYLTLRVFTEDAQVVEGVVVEENDDKVVLKDATGKLKTIPASDIELKMKGGTLMPNGLTIFLTRDELIDLVGFLSQLGKPGPYAIPTVPSIRRWRVMLEPPTDLLGSEIDDEAVQEKLQNLGPEAWASAYSRVDGSLPLDELTKQTIDDKLILRGEVEVTAEGKLQIDIVDPSGLLLWIDGKSVPFAKKTDVELSAGKHTLVFRVDRSQRKNARLKVDLAKPSGSTAQFTAVGGP